MQSNQGSPSNQGSKSFKEVLAERNKQAQRRFRQRQKVHFCLTLHPIAPFKHGICMQKMTAVKISSA